MLSVGIVKKEKSTEIGTEPSAHLREGKLITPTSDHDLTNTCGSDQVEDMLTSLLLVTNYHTSDEEWKIGLTSNATGMAYTNVQSTENYIPSSVSVGAVTHSKSDNILDSSNMSTGYSDVLLDPVEGDTRTSSMVDCCEKGSTEESTNSGRPRSDVLKISSEKHEKEFEQSPVEKMTPEKPEGQDLSSAECLVPPRNQPSSDGMSDKNTKEKQSVQSDLQDVSKSAELRTRSKRNAKNSHTKAKRRCSRDNSNEGKTKNKEGTYHCMKFALARMSTARYTVV